MDYGIINDRSPHIIADLCEIISFFEAIPVSRGDIESFIATKGGEGLLHTLLAEGDTERNEKVQRLTEDAFRHLSYRSTAFGQWYPFAVNHDVIELKEAYESRHKIYITLLLNSRLKMLPRPDRIRQAREFEVLCHAAIPALFPLWQNYHFGAGGADRNAFGNRLMDALPALASVLKETILPDALAELSPHDVGDGGIDLVSVYEWNDHAPARPAYFGQCAAQQENWPEKRFEAHAVTHERFFSFFHKPGTMLFIPVCYRGTDGLWIDSAAHGTILIDRLRLTALFEARLGAGELSLIEILAFISVHPEPGSFVQVEENQAAA